MVSELIYILIAAFITFLIDVIRRLLGYYDTVQEQEQEVLAAPELGTLEE